MKNDNYDLLKNWWNTKDNPLHAHKTDEWFQKYYNEFKEHFLNKNSIIDACYGSGEFLDYMLKDFNIIYAIDYSATMLQKAQERVREVKGSDQIRFSCADIMEIDNLVKEPVDIIFSNGVIQYLGARDLNIFIEKCSKLIKPDGVLIIANVLDYNSKALYEIGYFHTEGIAWSSKRIVIELIKKRWLVRKGALIQFLKANLLKKKTKKSIDLMGYWHNRSSFKEIAEMQSLNCEIINSKYPPYGYRFHVLLKHS